MKRKGMLFLTCVAEEEIPGKRQIEKKIWLRIKGQL